MVHKLQMAFDFEGTPAITCNIYPWGVLAGSLIAELVILVVAMVIVITVMKCCRRKQRCSHHYQSMYLRHHKSQQGFNCEAKEHPF